MSRGVPVVPTHLTWQNRAVVFKGRLTPATGFAILETYLSRSTSFLEEDARESNAIHSAMIAEKRINISIPAYLWSYGYYFRISIFFVAKKSPALSV